MHRLFVQQRDDLHDHPFFVNANFEIVLVHRVNVTPTAIFLAGPFAEVKNRVLRKYEEHVPTSFLRVSFTEEDGNPIWGEPNVSLTTIFHQRYQSVLDHAIRIGGKSFEFLGFSHSSLRERTCWFMAPITYQGRQLQADRVINDLGDFSAIRTPAKCAARIGQAFTETPETLRIPATCVKQIPDIERNNRVFSDGVGTISGSIVAQLWRLPSAREHPTLFQIRFRGAKGMIALDSRLEGEQLCIRPSMTKFGTRDHTDLEICGSGARTLQFYLNRQLIKILEDLGVPIGSFTTLQEIAVNELRMATTTPVNAASFLERHNIGKGTSLPWLIRKLHYIDVSFFEDPFLRSCIELAILTQLREIKYRARILVHDGVTLYGIMDETDTLKEGEIYCRTDRAVVEGIVYVSRSPAMHPGDIQKVKAVDVPEGSPLEALHNCIVFSQRGARDLPSMLSGGDLDGDMFHVIFDPNLYPNLTVSPADYPRVSPEDIGRAVNRHDMTEFFVDFMENDQLGRISNLHMQLADQKPGGTMDEDCIKLAEMASTAVDFSKTGIKVDMMQAPRSNTYRPDFMAPGPFIKLDQTTPRIAYQEEALEEDEEDIVAAQDPDKRTTKYYESDKALGVLYRRIDEAAFYDEINKHASGFTKKRGIVAQKIWDYVQGQVQLVFWGHHVPLAREIKEE